MKLTGLTWPTLLIVFLASFSVVAKDKARGVSTRDECRLISSKTAMNKAARKTGGKVVSIKLSGKGKGAVYRVRVLVGEKRIKNITIKACK